MDDSSQFEFPEKRGRVVGAHTFVAGDVAVSRVVALSSLGGLTFASSFGLCKYVLTECKTALIWFLSAEMYSLHR